MSYWQFSSPILYHGKGFTLSWVFPTAWLVLVNFRNGESKPWYRRTERNYRFRRWFFKKGKDRFRNIANFSHPIVTLWVFRGFSPIPERIQIPMDVAILRINEPEANPEIPGLLFSPACKIRNPETRFYHPDDSEKMKSPVFTAKLPEAPGLGHHQLPNSISSGLEIAYLKFRQTNSPTPNPH